MAQLQLSDLRKSFGQTDVIRGLNLDIADGEFVVVECEGSVATKAGQRYDNKYCYVIQMADGKMIELIEYMDTALADRVLAPPHE